MAPRKPKPPPRETTTEDEQVAAGVEAVKAVLRSVIAPTPGLLVRQLKPHHVTQMAGECIAAYVRCRYEQVKVHGPPGTLGGLLPPLGEPAAPDDDFLAI